MIHDDILFIVCKVTFVQQVVQQDCVCSHCFCLCEHQWWSLEDFQDFFSPGVFCFWVCGCRMLQCDVSKLYTTVCVCVCVVEFLWWWRFGTETPPAETSWWDEPPSSCLTCWALRGADSWHRRESRAGDKLTRTGSPWSNHTGRKQHWLTDWSCDACEPPLNNCFLHQPQWKGGRAELCGNAGGPGVG